MAAYDARQGCALLMGKKLVGRHGAKLEFRESDFAGRPPQEQAKLSGSLNQLSLQLAATRQLLRDIEDRSPGPDAAASRTGGGTPSGTSSPSAGQPQHIAKSSDDDTAP